MISILHPCRSRVEKSWHCMSEWILRAGKGIDLEVIISIDSSDPRKNDFLRVYEGFQVIVNDNKNAVQAVNRAADVATGDVLIVVSDDFTCPTDWGSRVERAIKGRRDFVLKTADGIQPYIVTLPILDRVYFDRTNYVYNPIYDHMFCLHPDTMIYMGDYSFKRIADVRPGDHVIGTHKPGRPDRTKERESMTRTTVTAVHKRIDQIYEITLESGKILRSTIDHKWGYYHGGRPTAYGPPKIGRRLKKIIDLPPPPPVGYDWERGWLAGMWDGEGSFDCITQSINHNPATTAQIQKMLDLLGFKYTVQFQTSKIWKNSTQKIFTIVGGRNEFLKLFNWLNPIKRISKRADKRMLTAKHGSPDAIKHIRYIGEGEVICLTTETGNFIADGYLSHNCDTEFTHVADLLGRIITRQDIHFQHNHYSNIHASRRPPKDEVTLRADATFESGKKIYLERVRNNFGMTRNALDISNEEHKMWLKANL